MNLLKYIFPIFICFGLLTTSCELDDIPNPNGSSVNDLLNDANKSELQTLVTGTESLLRKEVGFYYDVTSIIGRDYWFFTGSDPRYTGELLGRGEAQLDNAGFYGTRPFAARYKTVKNANILIQAVANSTQISAEESNGYLGFSNTVKAYELLLVLNLQYQNGIRLDVADPDKLGGFVSYEASLAGIQDLLQQGFQQLQSAGDAFPFSLSTGFSGFDTPETFGQFNRAIAARVAIYQGNKNQALQFLDASFLDLEGDFATGPARTYSLAGGEVTNPVFRARNQADAIIVHPSFIDALEDGDDRASKVALRDSPLTLDGLTGAYDVVVFNNLEAPIPFITNEELILIYAEANIGTDNSQAERALNIIRTGHGLDAVSGLNQDELVDELLQQRWLSLFGEGHRWVDMRRYDRLEDLPLDRTGDDVWVQLPRPVTEQG